MSKKIFIFLLTFLFVGILFIPQKINAKTLKNLYDELNILKAEKAEQDRNKQETENKKSNTNKEIYNATKEIENCEIKIDEATEKINELDEEIIDKKEEIENFMRTLQISKSGNAYLNYIFSATSYTDLIYRSAIIEQFTSYNNSMINEMYAMIEENKKLKIDLSNKKIEQNNLIVSLGKKLKSLNSDLSDIAEIQLDLAAQIKAQEESIKYYEKAGCDLDEELSKCIKIPFAIGFTRPLVKGTITSNFGYRVHPLSGSYKFHNAVDIGGNSEGTPIYASAAGIVVAKVIKSSCGGNALYIHHTIKGVNYTTQYLHLLSFNVNVGDVVSEKTIIGYVGGGAQTRSYDKCSTGAHLHFGIGKGWYMGDGYTSYSTWINNCINPKDYIYFPSGYWYTRYY